MFVLVMSGMSAAASASRAGLTCVDPLIKVFRGATNLPAADKETDVAAGEFATFQFVFHSPVAVTNLRAAVSGRVPGAQARFVGYVTVGKRRCEDLWSNDKLFPDPLLEDASVAVSGGLNQPVWITVPTSEPGELRGTLTVTWNGGKLRQSFKVHVHKVKLKKPRLWITNWWYSDLDRLAMLAGHPVVPYSEEYWKLIREIADFMAQYHQNMALILPLDLAQISGTPERLNFDFSRFDRMVQTFIDAGVIGRIEGGHVGGRSSGVWESQFFVRVPQLVNGSVQFTNLPATNAIARGFYRQYFPALLDYLKERGWDKIYWQHLADEPIPQNASSYRDIAMLLHEFAPGIPVMDAVQTHDLTGSINTWVPVLDYLHGNYDFMHARQQAGDEVWTYTCCIPGGSYANRFIELQLIKPRLLHWINFRYGITGYLHWGFNYWNIGTSPFGETTFSWPAGDQWIVYPRDGRLFSSIRLEAMRDGIEDYELLSMLSERDPADAQRLANETILGFDRYDTDIPRFRARHLELIKLLESRYPQEKTEGNKDSQSLAIEGVLP